MPNSLSVENNFIGGLKTEFTGLNFPENACTSATNCVFSIIGDVLSREGIDYEANFTLNNIVTANAAVNYYRWRNAGGDGASELLVIQVGSTLYFFRTSAATAAAPASAQLLMPTVNINTFLPTGSSNNPAITECQFADGNGYLFVFHPNLDPFFVTFTTSTGVALVATRISVTIRDFFGIAPEPGNPTVTFRPTTLSAEHNYNLQNQGWTNASTWTTSSNTNNLFSQASGSLVSLLPFPGHPPTTETFTVASGLTVSAGTQVNINWSCGVVFQSPGDGNYNANLSGTAVGTVTSYAGTTMSINVISSTTAGAGGTLVSGPFNQQFTIASTNLINTITTWNSSVGNFPSNADIWWTFITPNVLNTTSSPTATPGTFNPSVMLPVVPLSATQAPQGHFLLPAFNQDRTAASGIPFITPITTPKRPRTGCWFQGRVWYSGVDDAQPATGDVPFYTWTENIYFSQIVSSTTDFGQCYQNNDPTDNKLFNLLPTDGGVIVIQGSGPIYKLFPIQNGLLVFAANGVWLVRGNSGLGFTANDYSINKLSAVKSISSTSYVDVNGLPFFWNSEGIYRVAPAQAGAPYGLQGFEVEPLTVGTILSFYNNIPYDSKRFVRGSYDPISYILTWVYRSSQEAGISNRYQYDSALNLNVFNRAFYPYTFGNNGLNTINGVVYVDYPTGSLFPNFKYITSTATQLTFAEERDNVNWIDWFSTPTTAAYTSSFTTGYKVHGKGTSRWQPIYVNVYARNIPFGPLTTENGITPYTTEDGLNNYVSFSPTSGYVIQGTWDYANTTSTGKVSSRQIVNNPITFRGMASGISWPDTFDFDNSIRRHRITGHGQVLQLDFTNIPGLPMHIIGWSIPEQINVSA